MYKFLFYEKTVTRDVLLNDDLKEAYVLYEKGEYINAMERFNIILKKNPDNKEAKEYWQLCKDQLDLKEETL